MHFGRQEVRKGFDSYSSDENTSSTNYVEEVNDKTDENLE